MLESSHAVDVVRYDLNRIVEVKPRGVSKGITARKIVNRYVKISFIRGPYRKFQASR